MNNYVVPLIGFYPILNGAALSGLWLIISKNLERVIAFRIGLDVIGFYPILNGAALSGLWLIISKNPERVIAFRIG
jgi:hypothetical protein